MNRGIKSTPNSDSKAAGCIYDTSVNPDSLQFNKKLTSTHTSSSTSMYSICRSTRAGSAFLAVDNLRYPRVPDWRASATCSQTANSTPVWLAGDALGPGAPQPHARITGGVCGAWDQSKV